jgi:hypothetical protein
VALKTGGMRLASTQIIGIEMHGCHGERNAQCAGLQGTQF